ncbi:MAG: CinA family protein [Hyphomonadaceae bacterium]|nr:CinA family protein [Hyphomonadaceae bacterium]
MDRDKRLAEAARTYVQETAKRKLLVATAESCTGGLIAATMVKIPGSSAMLDRGFVTYSNAAKSEMLGVPPELIAAKGAVSKEVAVAMAEGALAHSRADITVAVTGIAGPDGGSAEKPLGLVHFAAARKGRATLHEEHRFGDIGRNNVQEETVLAAFALMTRLLN